MKIGKVPNDILKKIVLDRINEKRSEILLRPGIGEDCCAVDFGDDICILSTDPITGTAKNIGMLAVHVSCNDIAACGAEPFAIMVTILAPPSAELDELDSVMKQICATADSINVDIIGGHTEVTNAVTRFVITSTAVGKLKCGSIITTAGSKAGDKFVMTKSAGLEGTAIIADEKSVELKSKFGDEMIERAKSYMNDISVLKEGMLASAFGATSMHDVTEGGLMGAVWEMCEASGNGAILDKDEIFIAPETKMITDYYVIDPLKLISSGSMLITCRDGEGLVALLESKGIQARIIGEVTGEPERTFFSNGQLYPIVKPDSDELYKVLD